MTIIEELKPDSTSKETILTIGVFDGVHLGHRHLMSELKKQAKKEFETLNSNKEKSIKMTPDIEKLYLKLKETNLKLWKIEDEIRACEKNSDFKENFIKLARSVYFNNDTRSSLKLSINQKLGSNIIEVKEYTKY